MIRQSCRQLTPQQWAALEAVADRHQLDAQVLRARAVLRFCRGERYVDLCAAFGMAHKTLAGWVKRFRTEGMEGLRTRRPPGRPARVHPHVAGWLPGVIHLSPRSLGAEQDRWSVPLLQDACAQQTGVRPSAETMRRCLHACRLSWKRAKRTITSPDPEYAEKEGR